MIIKAEEHEAPETGRVMLNNKTIWFFGEVGVQSTGNFIAALEEADQKKGPIIVNICSGGGWVEGGLAMHDAIATARNEVVTIGKGAIYSSAVLPFMAGDTRIMYPNTRLFFHDLSVTMGQVTAKSAKAALKEVDDLYEIYCKIVSDRCDLDPSTVAEFCQEETYITADTALATNMTDEIVGVRQLFENTKKSKGKKK